VPAACFAMVRGSVVRITRLDAQGRVLMGPRSSLVTDGIAKMQIIQKESESQGFRQATPDGDLRIYLPAKKDPETFSTDITLTGTDPDAVELLTGNPVVTDDEGKIVGFDMTVKRSQRAAVALEVWSRLAVPVLGYRYAYTIIPFVKGGRLSGLSFENGLVTFSVLNAQIRRGSKWARGPYTLGGPPGSAGWDGDGWDFGPWDEAVPVEQECVPYVRAPWSTTGWDGGPWDSGPWDDGASGVATGWDGGGWDAMPWDAPVIGLPPSSVGHDTPRIPARLIEPIDYKTLWRVLLTVSKPNPSCGARSLYDEIEGNSAVLDSESVDPDEVLDNAAAAPGSQVVDTIDGGGA